MSGRIATPIYAAALLLTISWPVGADTPTYKLTRTEVERLSRGMQETLAGLQYLLNGYQVRQFLSLDGDAARIDGVNILALQAEILERDEHVVVAIVPYFAGWSHFVDRHFAPDLTPVVRHTVPDEHFPRFMRRLFC